MATRMWLAVRGDRELTRPFWQNVEPLSAVRSFLKQCGQHA